MENFDYRNGSCDTDFQPPQAWPRTSFGVPEVPMTWHHVVPRSLLRHSWNTLARHQSKSDQARNALHTFMRIVGFTHAEAKELLKTMTAGTVTWEQRERIGVSVGYPPWDIVEGPSNRSDDPEDSFDEYVTGLTPAEASRQTRLQSLFSGLRIFNQATTRVGTLDAHVFTALFTQLCTIERTLVDVKAIIPFRQSMWEVTPRPGNVELVPAAARWRKRRAAKAGTPTAG